MTEPTLPTSSGSLKDQLDIDLTLILVHHDIRVREADEQATTDPDHFTLADLSAVYATSRAALRAIIDGHRIALSDDDYEYGIADDPVEIIRPAHEAAARAATAEQPPKTIYRRIKPGLWERLP